MLTHLSVSNYALIESLELDFMKGFTVITGETGSGKSILLGALGLALGNRAEADALLDKEKKCIVEAVFSLSNIDLSGWFIQHELDYSSECVMRREIATTGKSRAFINDTPVNLSVMKELGEQLIDIHSQHESLHLTESTFQLMMLDHLAGTQNRLSDYRKMYKEYRETCRQLEDLRIVLHDNIAEQDYIRYQYNELKEARLSVEEYVDLEQQLTAFTHAEEIVQALFGSIQLLHEHDQSVISQTAEARVMIRKVESYLPLLADVGQRLDYVLIELKDIARELNQMADQSAHDPHEIQRIQERIGLINQLMIKHRARGIEELIALKQQFEARMDDSFQLEEQIEHLEQKEKILKKDTETFAAELSYARNAVSERIGDEVTAVLKGLGMPNAVFQVQLNALEVPGPDGIDKVRFLFSANLGGQVQDISRIASGGEMSRLMLAVKSLLAKHNMLPTIIFDEIDTGVSGEVASRMGRIMAVMSEGKQVISITHLPQIAGKAKQHLYVFKVEQALNTRTKIETLDTNQRVREIARLLSDDVVTEASIKAAIELMN